MNWYVYASNLYTRDLEIYNVFKNSFFKKNVLFLLESCKTKEEFDHKLQQELKYRFDNKKEWELSVEPSNATLGKSEIINVYTQVMLNFNTFADYCWSKREQ